MTADREPLPKINEPKKKFYKPGVFLHGMVALFSFTDNDGPQARITNFLLVFLVTTILLALVLSPLVNRTSDSTQLLLVQSLLGGALLLVLVYGLANIKHSQANLRRSNEQFRLISYATSDVVWDWNILSGHREWNQSIQRTFGYTADQISQDIAWWGARIYPDDRIKVIKDLHTAIETGDNFWSGEYRFCCADGSYAHVFDRGYILHDDQDKPVRMLGAMMDITRWRYVEQELATERNLLRTLVDLLPDRIYVKDKEARFVLKNLADVRAMGATTTDEVVGKTDFDYYAPELASLYFADDQAVIQSGQPLINREEPALDVNGNRIWVLTTKVPLRDSQGQITGLVGIGHDVTERKQIEDALQQGNHQLTTWNDQLKQRSHETALLNELRDLLQTCPSEQEAYTVIGEMSRLLFPEDAGRMYMINASRNLVEAVASWGISLPAPPLFKPEDCWGLRLGHLHLMEKGADKANHSEDMPYLVCNHIENPGLDSFVCVPLVAQGEALGLLYFRHSQKIDQATTSDIPPMWFSDDRQQLIRSVASSLGLALANLRLRDKLRQQSIRDSLTGLFNRRYLEETIAREVHRVDRNQHPLGVIMIDVDHFKRFNDAHGHEAGDVVLREMGVFLSSQVRGEDIPCRYGGEEFILILPDAPLEVTKLRAEKLRVGIQQLNLVFKGQPLGSITVSLGVAIYPEHGSTADAVIRAADAALYCAKKAGRNRVAVAEIA